MGVRRGVVRSRRCPGGWVVSYAADAFADADRGYDDGSVASGALVGGSGVERGGEFVVRAHGCSSPLIHVRILGCQSGAVGTSSLWWKMYASAGWRSA